jgi:hypothetical protein
LADGKLPEALSVLEALIKAAESAARFASVIEAKAMRSLALVRQSDHAAAIYALQSAIGQAEQEGFERVFLIQGKPMADLISQIRQTKAPVALVSFASKLWQEDCVPMSFLLVPRQRPGRPPQWIGPAEIVLLRVGEY